MIKKSYLAPIVLQMASVQFSHSVVSDSLQPHGLQYSRLPCPSPTPGAYSNSRPSSQWCHPTIWSSVVPFSSHLQFFQPCLCSTRTRAQTAHSVKEACSVSSASEDGVLNHVSSHEAHSRPAGLWPTPERTFLFEGFELYGQGQAHQGVAPKEAAPSSGQATGNQVPSSFGFHLSGVCSQQMIKTGLQ